MSASNPLSGSALISCAKANVASGARVAAQQCGFGDDLESFRSSLRDACEQIGIEAIELEDLESTSQMERKSGGVEISPDTYTQL